MMPYRNENLTGNVPTPARYQSIINFPRATSISNIGMSDKSPTFHSCLPTVPQNNNFSGTRIMACRPSSVISQSSNMNVNVSQSSEAVVGSVYQIQPNSNFISQWQNQQMTIGVLSAPVGKNISLSSINRGHLISPENEVGIVQNQMFHEEKFQRTESSVTAPKKRNFQFAVPSESSVGEKENLKKLILDKDVPADFRHFVGSVEQVIRWHQIAKSYDIFPIYEVHGILECRQVKQDIVFLIIKQVFGEVRLQGIFCAIDRPFPQDLQTGDNVVCVGKMKGAKKMQVLSAWKETAAAEDYTRISFLCQRAVTESLPEPNHC